ncbi:MAG TPA: site-specific DNA-methyltransferase [Syntrophomonas sp.]|jgi:site-specific DNA-methyltransferase (adenine-specific)|nr:site-specific DNA-methyltransferase [Syntrophomonas sp.]HRW11891.1 site-specific DNA-methyltransferase [Syntrophomonas sp.]
MSRQNSIKLEWAGKDRPFMQEEPVVLLPEIQHVYPFPLFTDSNLLASPAPTDTPMMNQYYQADNLHVLQALSQAENKPSIQLIYIDPPYMSQIHYRSLKEDRQQPAFADVWQPESYLAMLYPRLQLMKEVLADNGSIFVHVDWHVSHYVHLLLDEIFGPDNFINEIVWCYSGGGNSRRHLLRKHDLIFWYAKSSAYTYHPQHRPYTKGTLARGLTAVKGDKYKLAAEGALLQDWWTDINKILSPTAHENLKYPTQKPRQLLKRIITMASNPGDRVADFFAGSGTTGEVCNQLGRSWIMCDNSSLALQTTLSRLVVTNSPPFAIHACALSAEDTCGGEKDAAAAALRLQDVALQPQGTDQVWLSMGIDHFMPQDLPESNVLKDFSETIEFWEIDPEYDGKIFRSRYQILRSHHQRSGDLPLNVLLSQPLRQQYRIAVKVHDIFARQYLRVLAF